MNRAVLAVATVSLASWWCAGCAASGYPTAPYETVRVAGHNAEWGEFQLTKVTSENMLDFANSVHRIKITVDGNVRVRAVEPPITIHSIPTIDRCVLDDGTDITMLHQSQTPGQFDRRIASFTSGPIGVGMDHPRNVSSSFLNVPPRSYQSIAVLEGHFPASRPVRVETIRIPLANDTPTTTPSGWTAVVQGLPAEGAPRTAARIIVTRPGVGFSDDLAGPRIQRIELIDDNGLVTSAIDSRRSAPHLDGVAVEFEEYSLRQARSDQSPKPTAIRIEFVPEHEVIRIPFAYRNIRLTR
jgi:hypothetical protein